MHSFRKTSWLVCVLLVVLVLTGCKKIEKEGSGTATVRMKLNHGQSSSRMAGVNLDFTDGVDTELIALVADNTPFSQNYQSLGNLYQYALTDLSTDTVSLTVPLDTGIKLYSYVFFGEIYTASELTNSARWADQFGKSSSFTISSGDTSKEVTLTIVDVTAPTVAQVTGVTTPTNDTTPAYTFSSSESGTISYGGSCSSATTSASSGNNTVTFNALSDGTYSDCTLTVTDADGNASSTLSVTSFTVDATAPTVAQVTGVTTPTNDTTPSYTFSSSETGTITYGGSCSSPTTSASSGNNAISFSTLSEGTYSNCTITVTDSAGNASSTLSVTSFTVDTTAPTVAQVTGVTTPTNDTTPAYTFSSSESGTISYGGSCSSATTSASSGNNTVTFNALSDGTYSDCTLTVTDADGNASSTLSVTSFTVDATAPTVAQVTGVTTPTNDTTPSYTFSSSETGTITYGGSCSSPTTSASSENNTISFNALAEETYSDCSVKVTDNATNESNTLTVSSFTIDITAPTVSSVSSSTVNGTYRTDGNITLTVTFSEQVTVDNSNGNPIIQLETGSTDRYAIYSSGSGTDNLSLIYTVVISDNSTDLGYKASNSLELNSGTIRDSALNDAVLTLPNPGSSNSLSLNKAIVINTTSIFGTSKFDKSIFGP